ncbi:MAG: class I SAM-dependent methyltransferase [Thermoplasmata archaeon]|nr:MAG: class I SAM-dependent methyltransferase [Thermoplasmata archaeon]
MKAYYELDQLRGKDVFTLLNRHTDSIDEYFWSYYKNHTIRKFEQYIQDICHFTNPKGKVISIGCGHGLNEIYMADMCKEVDTILGIDIMKTKIDSMNAIIELFNLGNIKGIVGDATQIDFPDRSFDGVIVIESLSHVNDQYQVLKELNRILKKKGWIFVLDFNNGANPRILYRCWKENRMKGEIDESPVNPYFVRNRLRDLGVSDVTIRPYSFTPFMERIHVNSFTKGATWLHLLWAKGFMLMGKK